MDVFASISEHATKLIGWSEANAFDTFSEDSRTKMLAILSEESASTGHCTPLEKLIVLALARDTNRHWTIYEIEDWILRLSRYYAGNPWLLNVGFEDALRNYDLNLMKSHSVDRPLSRRHNVEKFYIAKDRACHILRNDLFKGTGKAFPFMRLPPELRTQILRLHLTYPDVYFETSPKPGNAASEKAVRGWNSYLRIGRPKSYINHRQRQRETPLQFNIPKAMLAVLAVSRQLYLEAMPIFYQNNRLHFEYVYASYPFLGRLSPKCRKHLGDISINTIFRSAEPRYERADGQRQIWRDAIPTFALLRQCKKLQILHFGDFHLIDTRAHPHMVVGSDWAHPERVSAFRILGTMRGLRELTFEYPDDFPNLDAYLRSRMLRPRSKFQPKASWQRIQKAAKMQRKTHKRGQTGSVVYKALGKLLKRNKTSISSTQNDTHR